MDHSLSPSRICRKAAIKIWQVIWEVVAEWSYPLLTPTVVRTHHHHSLRESKHHRSRLATIVGNTPQLKFAQKWIDAHIARDCKIDALFSKDYKHQTLPESLGLPEETREEYMKRYEGIIQVVTKMEVCIQRWVTASGSQTDIHHP